MDADLRELVAAAVRARQFAYAPYSKFAVGAALLTSTGEVATGCNVENASYGLTLCAERNAVFAAVARGFTQFQAIAISHGGSGAPCGACRQVLSEFAPKLTIFMADAEGSKILRATLDELLPQAFAPADLRN